EANQRIEHLQHALDSIALNVERIGEAQRDEAKILEERVETLPKKEHEQCDFSSLRAFCWRRPSSPPRNFLTTSNRGPAFASGFPSPRGRISNPITGSSCAGRCSRSTAEFFASRYREPRDPWTFHARRYGVST